MEAEAGSSLRHSYDESTFERVGSRELTAPHPFAYGFVVGTRNDDGDAVDCYLLTTEPVRAGQLLDAETIGLLEQFEDGVPDHKLLVVLSGETRAVDKATRSTLERFITEVFRPYPHVQVEVGRLLGGDAATAYVAAHPAAKES